MIDLFLSPFLAHISLRAQAKRDDDIRESNRRMAEKYERKAMEERRLALDTPDHSPYDPTNPENFFEGWKG